MRENTSAEIFFNISSLDIFLNVAKSILEFYSGINSFIKYWIVTQ